MKEITQDILADKIYNFILKEIPKFNTNEEYYHSNQEVNKGKIISGRPNNILRSNICKYITDVQTGYFMGIPMTFDFEDEIASEQFRKVMKTNYFDELLFNLARDMSIYGTAFCQAYKDENEVKCVALSPKTTFMIYSDELTKEVLGAVQFTDISTYEIKGKLYTKGFIQDFSYADKSVILGIKRKNSVISLPIVEFPNNKDRCGDFYPILSLMDAYNVLLSGAMDDMQSVANAFLAIYGMQGTTREDIEEANRSRVLSLAENGKAEFIVKNVNSEAIDSLKKTLMENILMVTMTPNLNDESFGNNTSGVAMEYKLWGIEQSRSEKQRNFSRSVYILLELLQDIFGWSMEVALLCKIRFYKNLPHDTAKIVENIGDLENVVSHKTKLELLPFVEDAGKELEQIKKERENEPKES